MCTMMRIVEAIDLDWLVVQGAIVNARTENEMIDLAHIKVAGDRRPRGSADAANALPA